MQGRIFWRLESNYKFEPVLHASNNDDVVLKDYKEVIVEQKQNRNVGKLASTKPRSIEEIMHEHINSFCHETKLAM